MRKSKFQGVPEEKKELSLVWEIAREKCISYAKLLEALKAANAAEEDAEREYKASVSMFGEEESTCSKVFYANACMEHKVLYWESVVSKRELDLVKWRIWSEEEFVLESTREHCREIGSRPFPCGSESVHEVMSKFVLEVVGRKH